MWIILNAHLRSGIRQVAEHPCGVRVDKALSLYRPLCSAVVYGSALMNV